jgi:predicted esterase
VKRTALRVTFELAALWPAALSAACALAPTHRSVLHGGSAAAPPNSPSLETLLEALAPSGDDDTVATHVGEWPLLGKNLDNIPRQPHLTTLPVPGFLDAVVAAPFVVDDAARARPVVIALHGLGDRPEPHCEAWRTITSAWAFVLCPRGAYDPQRSGAGPRYTHPGGWPLRAHIEAALASLTARYGPAVDTAHPLLTGFSLGATEAALLAQADAERFPRVAVLEGGLDVWNGETIEAYTSHGGLRVLFGCGSSWCTPPAREAVARIDGAGIGARMAFADVGHHPAPALQSAIKGALQWLVEGDSRWGEE